MQAVIQRLKKYIEPGTIITDVGSVKLSVIEELEFTTADAKGKFVPSHPIAGTERSGPDAGYAGLFEDRWCILTPTKKTNKRALRSVETFWKFLGMQTKIMTPEHHDLVLAVTSHAPHLIAYTMVGVVDDLEAVTKSEIINYSAAGFRDFTRIAASDPVMWRDIFLNNQDAHLEVLGRFTEELFSLQRAIRKKDGEYLLKYFERTRSIRKGIVAAGQDTGTPNFGRD
jgi:cyclohexadieny/prephenate dehydrogenase